MSWRMLLLCFPKERHIHSYSAYASVFKNFGHTAWFQSNLIEISVFHGCRNLSREWRPSRENSCRVCPRFIRLQKNLHMQLQAELTLNHNSAPKHNSIENRFQWAAWLEVVDHWKRSVPKLKSGLWISQSTQFRKKDGSMGSKRMGVQILSYIELILGSSLPYIFSLFQQQQYYLNN